MEYSTTAHQENFEKKRTGSRVWSSFSKPPKKRKKKSLKGKFI